MYNTTFSVHFRNYKEGRSTWGWESSAPSMSKAGFTRTSWLRLNCFGMSFNCVYTRALIQLTLGQLRVFTLDNLYSNIS